MKRQTDRGTAAAGLRFNRANGTPTVFFGFSAKKTLSALQNLYDTISWSHTRAPIHAISQLMVSTLLQTPEKHCDRPPYARWAEALFAQPLNPGKRLVNDDKVSDHHAIIHRRGSGLSQPWRRDERKIYDLVIKRFLVRALSRPIFMNASRLSSMSTANDFTLRANKKKTGAGKPSQQVQLMKALMMKNAC